MEPPVDPSSRRRAIDQMSCLTDSMRRSFVTLAGVKKRSLGNSEELVGEALAPFRERIVIATKF